jgi:hypothetical protein
MLPMGRIPRVLAAVVAAEGLTGLDLTHASHVLAVHADLRIL